MSTTVVLATAVQTALVRAGLTIELLGELDDEKLIIDALTEVGLTAVQRAQVVALARRTTRLCAKCQTQVTTPPPPPPPAPPKSTLKIFTFLSYRAGVLAELTQRQDAAEARQRAQEQIAEAAIEQAPKKYFISALHCDDPGTDASGLFPMGAAPENTTELTPRSAALAHARDSDSIFSRGVVFATGAGAARDDERALQCFERAASLGHTEAAFKLGSMFEAGTGGVQQDLTKAVQYYRMASDGDDADAMFALATLLVRGETDEARSDAEVARLYEAAAERGHVKAMVAIADALTYGVGVSRNLSKAESWLRKAADLGYEIALLRLAAVLELVDPSPLGLRLACECYERAIALGCADAYRHLGMCLQRAGGASNTARAMECFRAAAECGDAAGMYYLSACLDIQARTANHTHHPTLIRSLSTGVESLAPDDLAEEAIAITLPESAVAQCKAEAKMWLQRAAELDYEPALSKLMLDL